MSETIYTIPINEAFELQDGTCPVCRLKARLERDALEYVMGAAMMEPDVRVETNKQGFCRRHLEGMLGMGNRLALSLILQSYLMEQSKRVKKYNPDSCFVCNRVDRFMAAYISNIFHIYESDDAFHGKLTGSKLCYPHVGLLMAGADKGMRRKSADKFKNALESLAAERFGEIIPLVTTFCNSFDHRFADQPLGDAKTAVEQTVNWIAP
ncbi:hypothetical protein FACS1894217_00130 [Clostridia bacterium]|nr:hypothetical protein FACS1894217_00130 [Clostridia bacterium]